MENRSYKAVILAAGYSSRMKSFKPLLPVGGETAVEKIVNSLKAAQINDIIIVTGHNRELLVPLIKALELREAYNPDYARGMFTSVKCGLKASKLNDTSENITNVNVMLWPVDCPLVESDIIESLLLQHEQIPEQFMVPCYKGKKGHPLIIPGCYIEDILGYSGDEGLKGAMRDISAGLIKFETSRESVVLDMDTPQGYKEVLSYLTGEKTMDYRGRIFLVRHGETEQHDEPVFIGQTDVPLDENGKSQAMNSGLELAGYAPNTDRFYTSDLQRAVKTAEIMKSSVSITNDGKEMELVHEPDFREIDLGEWDGRAIREIWEQYPDEYEKRGRDLANYKYGNDAENFYDLQYRVMKALYRILDDEHRISTEIMAGYSSEERMEFAKTDRDVIIVTHAGVIRVMLAELLGYSMEQALDINIPKGSITLLELKE